MSKQNPKYSILIPTVSRTGLVRTALESALKQTFRDFEIIIADAGTAKGTEELVAAIKQDDVSVRYFRTPQYPPFIPFNYSEEQARGEYFLWLDDDNYLLPFALELFNDAVKKTKADIITANHFYYYNENHPRHYLRNSLGIIPFTYNERFVDPREILKWLYTFSHKDPTRILPRLHPSGTLLSRKVAERARKRLGLVVFDDMPSCQPLATTIPFAQSVYFMDRPVAIVGRLGESMSQTWSLAARKRFEKKPFIPTFSPLTAYTRLNARIEIFLRAKHLLPDIFKDISIDYDAFAWLYLHELFYLDTNMRTAIRNWKNFFAFLNTLSPKTKKELARRARRMAVAIPFIYVARRLKLHHVVRWLLQVTRKAKRDTKTPRQRFQGTREFEIPLAPYPGVTSITSLAAHLKDILKKEIGGAAS